MTTSPEPQQEVIAEAATGPDAQRAEHTATGPAFIAACLVLPILWGVVVHQVFRRLRRRSKPGSSRDAHWSDYQI